MLAIKGMSATTFLSFALLLNACAKTGREQTDYVAPIKQGDEPPVTLQPDKNDDAISMATTKIKLTVTPPPAATWKNFISTLSEEERQLIESANQRYFGLLEFTSPQEYEAIIEAGFPSLEEWLQFEKMSDDELKIRAQANDKMAKLFYADRLAQYVEQAPGELGRRKADVERMAIDASVLAAIALRGSQDAFSAYVYGKVSSVQLSMAEPMAAAFMLASDRGDPRAKQKLHIFNNNYPDLRVDIVQIQYEGMKRDSRS